MYGFILKYVALLLFCNNIYTRQRLFLHYFYPLMLYLNVAKLPLSFQPVRTQVSVSVSACSGPPRLSAVSPRLLSKQCQYLCGWTQFVLNCGISAASLLLTLFPLGDQCWDSHASELLCLAKLQTRCDICCACCCRDCLHQIDWIALDCSRKLSIVVNVSLLNVVDI